jgi:cell division protein FtsZ
MDITTLTTTPTADLTPSTAIKSRFEFIEDEPLAARMAVIGVGGGGGNAVNNMIEQGISGVDFIVINTDQQALRHNLAPVKIQAGRVLTKGLGAGARPQVGAEAVEECRSELEKLLEGYDMVFITAGMGGGTGTGGAPTVAQIARKKNVLTVGVVTRPFGFEGKKRLQSCEQGIALLSENVDTLVVIPNERLNDIAQGLTVKQAFGMADDVLYKATRGIADLVTEHGLVNLDFADVRTTIQDGGLSLMGSGEAAGEDRAEIAAQKAITSPLFDGLSIEGARNVIVNITGSSDIGLAESTRAADLINAAAGADVEMIWGLVFNEDMKDTLRVTVIATGFDRKGELIAAHTSAPAAAAPVLAEEPEAHEEALEPEATPSQVTRITRSQPVDQNTIRHFKGEENLRDLDEPAFIRRKVDTPPAPAAKPRAKVVRRLKMDTTPDTPERKPVSKEPTFLRQQYD